MTTRTISNAFCLTLALVIDIAFPGHHCVTSTIITLGVFYIANEARLRPEPTEEPKPSLLGRFRARVQGQEPRDPKS